MAFELVTRTCRGSRSSWKRLRALDFVPAFVLGVLACAPAAAAQTAPTANAGADQTVTEGATVTLDGSGSSDSANRALTYAWSQTGGAEVELSSTGAVRPSFIAPTQLAANATLTFSLTVTAGGTDSQPDTVAITATAGSDDAPTADAGTDQTVYEGATVALDGTGSRDPEGQALTYAWSQTGGTSVTLSSASVVSPTFTAPSSLTATAALTFSLTVTASGTASQPDTVTITVPVGSTAPTTTAPTVGSVGFFGNPYSGDTYGVGERISVAVSFNTVVSVVGMPQVALTIGTRTRYATFYHANGRDTYFRYWTQPGDADTDGIAIPQNAVRLNGGAIRDATDTTVNAALTHSAVTADSDRKVNGRLVYPPRQAWVQIMSSPYSGDTYKLAETVTVNVRFNKAVRVIGTPSVELTIGTRKRQARYDSTIYSRVVFTYAVQAADADADGISIDANAIRLNGGAIKDVVATNTDAVLTHTAVAASTAQKVDGSLAPAVSRIRFHPSLLPSGGTYTKGDTMWLEVWFDQSVSVSGSPRLGLQIGSRTRQANGELSATDAHLMLFSYRVQAGDVDPDGVSIGANALTLNGGSIVSAADGTVNAVLTHDAVAVGRKVDGGPVTAPVVNRMLFNAATAPASGTYTKGTTIWVEVWFDQKVAVSGIPQLGLSIGSRTRQANGQLSTSNAQLVFFSYRVQAGDVDPNGVSIGADAMTLNGGSIVAAVDGTTTAALTHDAVAADATRKVDGGPVTAPVVTTVRFNAATAPASGTYTKGDTIWVEVWFDQDVTVGGTPQLGLGIGSRTRQASGQLGTTYARLMFFSYRVQAGEADADGVAIGANALTLNGGSIAAAADGTTNAVLTHDAVAADATRKVDGGPITAPVVTTVRFDTATAPASGFYPQGSTIVIEVLFDQDVTVGGTPQLGLDIGSRTRQADGQLSPANAQIVVFRYRVQADDVDTDGVAIGTNALTLNGGSIVAAIDGTTNAVLTHDAVAADATRKVGRPAPVDRQPFFTAAVAEQIYEVDVPVGVTLPAAVGGDGVLSYTLTPALPAGLTYTRPADTTTGGTIAGTPTAALAETTYTLTATDVDGDTAALAFSIAINDSTRLAPREGTTIYRVNGRRVTVTVRPGTPEDVEIVLPADLAEDVEVTLGPPAAEVPLRSARFGFGPEAHLAVVDIMVFDVPDGGLKVCLPVNADLRAEADVADRPVRLLHYDGSDWESVANARDLGRQVCASGVTTFSPFVPGYADTVPRFGDAKVAPQRYLVGETVGMTLPAALGGDGVLSYALTPLLPAGLTFAAETRGLSGTPRAEASVRTYTLAATDEDGDTATLTFPIEVARLVVSVADISVVEGAAAEFAVTLSETVAAPVMLRWWTEDGTAAAGEDYRAVTGTLTIVPGRREGTMTVQTVDDRRVEAEETFTVWVTGTANAEVSGATATGRIADDDAETARRRALGMVLAGVGRTLATDAVDVIGERFQRPASEPRAAFGGQELRLRREAETGRWRHAAGVAYGVARALGVEVGSPLGGNRFGTPGGATWGLLTRPAIGSPESARPATSSEPDEMSTGPWSRLAGYEQGLHQVGFDRAHAAHWAARSKHGLRMPVGFRRTSAREMLARSRFETPLGRRDAGGTTAWTLWGRGTANGFDGEPKNDFRMDGEVFSGYVGLDYRSEHDLLLGAAVGHSRGDVDYETRDVTTGEVDVELTSVLPYAHWSPRPGLGLWGLAGAGWGGAELQDEAGTVETDLEMLLAAVGVRQAVLTWRGVDLALKADAFLTELETDAEDGLPKTAGDAERLRLMLEGRTRWTLSDVSRMTPRLEIGGRWDGGKAETGVGGELGGGVTYRHTRLGVGIEAGGRYLLAHQKTAFDEWGANLTFTLDPGQARRGWWMTFAPVWGAETSRVAQMWDGAEAFHAGHDRNGGASPNRLEMEWGYGLVTHEGAGLVTPYGGLSMTGPGRRGIRLGSRIELGEWIDLSFEGERTTQGGSAEHEVTLRGHVCW